MSQTSPNHTKAMPNLCQTRVRNMPESYQIVLKSLQQLVNPQDLQFDVVRLARQRTVIHQRDRCLIDQARLEAANCVEHNLSASA